MNSMIATLFHFKRKRRTEISDTQSYQMIFDFGEGVIQLSVEYIPKTTDKKMTKFYFNRTY